MNIAQPRLLLGKTESVCPDCLATLPAERFAEGDTVFLEKTCPSHGTFTTPVWRGLQSYLLWGKGTRAYAQPPVFATSVQKGCPHDCGLCPDHRQQSCCVLLEVTSRCDIACPVCFASAGRHGTDASLVEIAGWLDTLVESGGHVHIQLSGGEPTMRDDLPEIVALVRAKGIDFVQLNTNGIRIASDTEYLRALVDAGLDCIFLQFDGVTDDVYRQLRGAKLMRLKTKAIRNCDEAGIGVVLVPTLVPGVNTQQIGDIVEFAKSEMPAVRAVHFQPVSYFGRAPSAPTAEQRITLPEVMEALIAHSEGAIQISDFNPGSAENPYCSFSGRFFVEANGRLRSDKMAPASCCGTPAGPELLPAVPSDGGCDNDAAQTPEAEPAKCCGSARPSPDVDRARRYVAGQWTSAGAAESPSGGLEAFDAFLGGRRRTLGISGMAFQDAWTLDVEKIRQCHIHVVAPDRRIIPFCAYNLTDTKGRSLYRPALEQDDVHD